MVAEKQALIVNMFKLKLKDDFDDFWNIMIVFMLLYCQWLNNDSPRPEHAIGPI